MGADFGARGKGLTVGKLVLDSPFNKGVHADAAGGGGGCRLPVQFRREPDHKLAAGLLFWFYAVFGAGLKKKIQRKAELAAQLFRREWPKNSAPPFSP